MEEVTINDDEMVGFIMRKVYEDTGVSSSYAVVDLILSAQMEFYGEKGLIEDEDLQEITVSTGDDEVIASISLTEGNGIVKNGYKITGFEKKETETESLESFSASQLHDELLKREGVHGFEVGHREEVKLNIGNDARVDFIGPGEVIITERK